MNNMSSHSHWSSSNYVFDEITQLIFVFTIFTKKFLVILHSEHGDIGSPKRL